VYLELLLACVDERPAHHSPTTRAEKSLSQIIASSQEQLCFALIMDKFVRVGKAIPKSARGATGKPVHILPQGKPAKSEDLPVKPVKSETLSTKIWKIEEWADIVSCDAESMDVSLLDDETIEDALRLFDLNPRYGPFSGIDRAFRWERAARCGLDPPPIIKALIDSDRALSHREAHLW